MIPVSLQIKCDKFLRKFRTSIPNNKELHLLIDIAKMEEYDYMIDKKNRHIFEYFAIPEEDRNNFFTNIKEYTKFYAKQQKKRKLSNLQILMRLRMLGYNIDEHRILLFYNPIKAKHKVDKYFNKKYKY